MFNILYFPQDEESAESSPRKSKRRTPFVSPFERYKRVLPMVAAEEAKEKEKREKEEAERLKRLEDTEKEITESKNRVYEHFKQVSTTVTSPVGAQGPNNVDPQQPDQSKKQKPVYKPLSAMQGRKRKRQSNYAEVDAEPVPPEIDLSTPVPLLGNRTPRNQKQTKREKEPYTRNRKKIKLSTSRAEGHSSHIENDTEFSLKEMR